MMMVHPASRRQGIGNALLQRALDHLRQFGVRCIKLDATPMGQPLYAKIGFVPEWTLTRWEHQGSPLWFERTPGSIHPPAEKDWPAIVGLDARGASICLRDLSGHGKRHVYNIISFASAALRGFLRLLVFWMGRINARGESGGSNAEGPAKSRQMGRHNKKLQMQGARILRNEAYIEVRRNDERCLPSGGKLASLWLAQRRLSFAKSRDLAGRWTFYEAVNA